MTCKNCMGLFKFLAAQFPEIEVFPEFSGRLEYTISAPLRMDNNKVSFMLTATVKLDDPRPQSLQPQEPCSVETTCQASPITETASNNDWAQSPSHKQDKPCETCGGKKGK